MKKIIALCAVLVASSAIAEPASVPHTFKDDSPAVADEVNANFQSLLNVLGGMKRLYLYQNSVMVGSAVSAVIVNVVKLNSSYLVMVDKPRGDSTIYLRSFFDELYYEGYDCSGATYTTETVEVDLLVGEVGAVVAVGDRAYYQDFSGTPATPTVHSALRNVSWNRVGGQCLKVLRRRVHIRGEMVLVLDGHRPLNMCRKVLFMMVPTTHTSKLRCVKPTINTWNLTQTMEVVIFLDLMKAIRFTR